MELLFFSIVYNVMFLFMFYHLKEVLFKFLGDNSPEERDTLIEIWEARKTKILPIQTFQCK
jgi:hypothetical protein